MRVKRRPTIRSVKANAVWLWRWRIARYFAPPLCVYCKRSANIYFGKAWFCHRHPLLIPGSALGSRPTLFPYTRRATEDLFKPSPGFEPSGLLHFTQQNLTDD